MSGRSTSASWVRGIAEMFAANGLDVQGIFSEAGIDLVELQKVDARVPTEKSQQIVAGGN